MAGTKTRRRRRWKRLSLRAADFGRIQEENVAAVLRSATKNGALLFSRVTYHKPGGMVDRGGHDFTVAHLIRGKLVSVSFGITTSTRRWIKSKRRHASVPQLWIPVGTAPESIVTYVLRLLDAELNPTPEAIEAPPQTPQQ